MRKAKIQPELTVVTVVSNNKKRFFMYVNSKGRSKENVGLILGAKGLLTSKEEEKEE